MGGKLHDTGDFDFGGSKGTRRIKVKEDLPEEPGDAEPRLVVMAGARLGAPYLILPDAEMIIGRDIDSDMVLESRSVSRQHARVTRDGNQVFIEDLDSANGVDVAGRRISARTEMRSGDLVRLGSATLKFFASASLESDYHSKIFDIATRDGLTELHNRSFFMDSLKRMVPHHAHRNFPLTVAIADLDYFKLINDEYGHDVGDLSLRTTARVFTQGIREKDVVARIGGEEFGFMFHSSDAEAAVKILTQLQADLLAATRNPAVPTLSFSAGVATQPRGSSAMEISDLLKSADLALYRAKEAGRDRVEVAD